MNVAVNQHSVMNAHTLITVAELFCVHTSTSGVAEIIGFSTLYPWGDQHQV